MCRNLLLQPWNYMAGESCCGISESSLEISQLSLVSVKFIHCYLLYCQSFWDHFAVVVPCNSFETCLINLLQSFVGFSVNFGTPFIMHIYFHPKEEFAHSTSARQRVLINFHLPIIILTIDQLHLLKSCKRMRKKSVLNQ